MKMNRTRLAGLLLLLPLFCLRAVAAENAASAKATAHHSLWKVTGGQSTVYLLGSIHLLKPENYPLAPPIETAFSNAQVAVFETDVGAMEQPEAQMKLMGKGLLPAGETLRQELAEDTFLRMSNRLADAGMPLLLVERMKPGLAAVTLEMLTLQKLDLDPKQGLDLHFYDLARKQGKTTVGLEALDFQIDLIVNLSKDEGELLIKNTLDEMDETKKVMNDILEAWKVGDASVLDKLLNDVKREAPFILKRFVTDRNERWVPQIEAFLKGDKPTVIIVGTAHMVGSDGLVARLEKKGWKVTQE